MTWFNTAVFVPVKTVLYAELCTEFDPHCSLTQYNFIFIEPVQKLKFMGLKLSSLFKQRQQSSWVKGFRSICATGAWNLFLFCFVFFLKSTNPSHEDKDNLKSSWIPEIAKASQCRRPSHPDDEGSYLWGCPGAEAMGLLKPDNCVGNSFARPPGKLELGQWPTGPVSWPQLLGYSGLLPCVNSPLLQPEAPVTNLKADPWSHVLTHASTWIKSPLPVLHYYKSL